MCTSISDGRLRFEGDGSGDSGFACRIEPDDGYVPFPVLTPNPPEDCIEYDCDFPLELPAPAPGSNAVNVNVFHFVNGDSNELLLTDRYITRCRTGKKAQDLKTLYLSLIHI